MSKTRRPNYRRGDHNSRKVERHIIVRSERRNPPDLRKLSRAVIAMALRDAEAKAETRDVMIGIDREPTAATTNDAECADD